jgi:replicative DNA helicase
VGYGQRASPENEAAVVSRLDAVRIPPQSIESEQSVLGGLMLAPDALAKLSLQPEDFYRTQHATIFKAICDLDRKGQPYDAVTLGDWFEAHGLAEQVEGGAYLIQLANNTPGAANIVAYAAIVRDKAVLRKLIEVATQLVGDGFSPNGRDSAALVDSGIGELMKLAKAETSHEATLAQAVSEAQDDMHEAWKSKGAIRGIPTGFARVDARLGGFHGGDLVVIGARPAMGKTALLVNLAEYAAEQGHCVGFISGEQSAMQLGQRALSRSSGIHAEKMRNGSLDDEDWPKLTEAVRRLIAHKFHILDRSAPTMDEIRRTARRWKQEHGMAALYVDYAQRVRVPKAQNRVEEVAEVARSMKEIARDLDIPVILLSQVVKNVDMREDKRPGMSDLANSDELTREADLIAMLYRDEIYNENSPQKGTAEFNVEKNRHGPCGQFRLAWLAQTMRFGNLAHDDFA